MTPSRFRTARLLLHKVNFKKLSASASSAVPPCYHSNLQEVIFQKETGVCLCVCVCVSQQIGVILLSFDPDLRENWTGDMKDTDLPAEPGSCATWTRAHTGTASRAENTIMHTRSPGRHTQRTRSKKKKKACLHTHLQKKQKFMWSRYPRRGVQSDTPATAPMASLFLLLIHEHAQFLTREYVNTYVQSLI